VFATMAALLHDGEAIGAWVQHPLSGERWVAQRGAGTWRNGQAVRTSEVSPPSHAARGAVLTRFLPPELRERIVSRRPLVGECLPGQRCAGVEYPLIVRDEQQFALFWRTLPWDHVPGSLLLTEAGGHVARFDGRPYRAADAAKGLLAAANSACWTQIRDALLGPA
jgi:fructose-1,6-bisphosphatase/inositol monophosphatase family enzyme